MNRNVGIGLTGLVIVLAGVVFQQNRELQAMRAKEGAVLQDSEIRSESVPAVVMAEEQAGVDPIPAPAVEPVPEQDDSTIEVSKDQMAAMGKMFKNPAMKEMMRASAKGALDATYGALFSYLNLSAEDEAFLKDLLVDRQMALMQVGLGSMDTSIPQEERNASAKQQKELAKVYEGQIEEFLGEEQFETFTQYEDTQPERMLVSFYSQSIDGEYQLSEDQEHDLIVALHEEREAFHFSTALADKENADLSVITDAAVDTHFEEIARLEERYIERAGEFLNEAGLNDFKESLQQQRAMQEASMRMAARMFANSGEDPAAP